MMNISGRTGYQLILRYLGMPHSKCGAFLWNYSIIHIEFLPERLIEQVIDGLKGEKYYANSIQANQKSTVMIAGIILRHCVYIPTPFFNIFIGSMILYSIHSKQFRSLLRQNTREIRTYNSQPV